jgi:hypothetical protein
MRSSLRVLGVGSLLLLLVAACGNGGRQQEALDAASDFVATMATYDLAGEIGRAVRHGPWWEVSVAIEGQDDVVLFIDPESYTVEHVERAPEDVVSPDEFLSYSEGRPAWMLGQTPPGVEPEAFRPDIFSVAGEHAFHLHSSLYFSSDGLEIYFTNQTVPVVLGRSKSIWVMRWDGEAWSNPSRAGFASEYNDDSIWLSPDGSRLYFRSERPHAEGEEPALGFWRMQREGGGWSEPELLLTAGDVMSQSGEFLPLTSMSFDDGHWYVSAAFPGSDGAEDIYRTEFQGNHYGPLVHLEPEVNSEMEDYAVCVAPDESFLLIYRFDSRKTDEAGLYVSFRERGDGWGEARGLGTGTKLDDAFDASLSPDGEYLFLLVRGDGIYWVDAAILDEMSTGNAD